MVPLAASGTAVIGIAVGGAVALLLVLLKREDRFEAMESAEKKPHLEDPGPEE